MATKITKKDAAQRQLDTGIRLSFENRDHLSAYTLAIVSRELTDDLIQSRYSELYQRELARTGDPLRVRLSYREQIKDWIKPQFYQEYLKLDRKWQNFLKHTDRDPNAEMELFTTKQLALVIFSAIGNFLLLTQHLTTEMVTFIAWIGAAEPQLVKHTPESPFSAAFAQMRENMTGDPYAANTLQDVYRAINAVIRS